MDDEAAINELEAIDEHEEPDAKTPFEDENENLDDGGAGDGDVEVEVEVEDVGEGEGEADGGYDVEADDQPIVLELTAASSELESRLDGSTEDKDEMAASSEAPRSEDGLTIPAAPSSHRRSSSLKETAVSAAAASAPLLEEEEEGGGAGGAESPVRIGEKLSRQASPTIEAAISRGDFDESRHLDVTTPTADDEEQELEPEAVEKVEQEIDALKDAAEQAMDKQVLIERYQEVMAEREKLQQRNLQLQHKLAEHFRKKKADEPKLDTDKANQEQEMRYLKYIQNLDQLKQEIQSEKSTFNARLQALRDQCDRKENEVSAAKKEMMDFRKALLENSVLSRTGRPMQLKDVESLFTKEDAKEEEAKEVRLENIKLRNKLKKREQQLKSKEELAEGLHLIEFEQLKIENQTYNEKIEERNEDLSKLRRKITNTVQVLTHLKEKVEFVQQENEQLCQTLQDLEQQSAQQRDMLTRTKQVRDSLRNHNQKLKEQCGLLTSNTLLRDYEDVVDRVDVLRSRLEELKMMHAEFSMNSSTIKKKIDKARSDV